MRCRLKRNNAKLECSILGCALLLEECFLAAKLQHVYGFHFSEIVAFLPTSESLPEICQTKLSKDSVSIRQKSYFKSA